MRKFLFVAALAGVLFVTSKSASADVLYQTGFEAPTFSLGNVSGQDGWFDNGAVDVVSSPVFAGSQALMLPAIGGSGFVGAQHNVSYNSVGNSQTTVDITGEFFLSTTGSNSIFVVASAHDASDDFIDDLLVTNGVASLGLASSSVGSLAVARGVYNSFDLKLDYTTDTTSAFVNGMFVGEGAFATSTTTLGDDQFGSFSGTDTATLDNLSITSSGPAISGGGSAVPLPSGLALGLASLGVLAFALRRRAFQAC